MSEFRDEAGKVVARARVRNLSAIGMMAECAAGFRAGDRIACELRAVGSIRGVVTWVRSGRIGIRFDERIDPQSVRRPVAAQRPAQRTAQPAVRFARPIRTY